MGEMQLHNLHYVSHSLNLVFSDNIILSCIGNLHVVNHVKCVNQFETKVDILINTLKFIITIFGVNQDQAS